MTYGIGKTYLKSLLQLYDNDAEAIVQASDKELLKHKWIHKSLVKKIRNSKAHLAAAEQKLIQLEKQEIIICPFYESHYPKRLLHCADFPAFIYKKGNSDLNKPYSIAIVGTRNATEMGKLHCKKIIESIAPYNPLIISGLALGIDGMAHKEALENNLDTVAVLGHGLGTIYPSQHRELAKKILTKNGTLLSEYELEITPEKGFFAERNRIIAGMVDAVIVVEAAVKGGAHITAELAIGYHRDVFAIPGRPEDIYSQGCNKLIKENKANLIESGDDIADLLGWSLKKEKLATQISLLPELNNEQALIIELLQKQRNSLHIDEISYKSQLLPAKLACILTELELYGIVRCLPGKHFECV